MDENIAQPQVVYASPNPWYKIPKKFVIISGIVLFIFSPLIAVGIMWLFQMPPFQTAKQIATPPTPSPAISPANPLIAQAKSIGYEIIWISPEDTTGRTIFYKERPKAEIDFRGTGLIYTQASGSATQRLISYMAGTFIGFEDIGNSPDLYMNLINPQTGIALPKIRLILTKDSLIKTFFLVEDLSKDATEGNLGNLADWPVNNLEKIIQKGDAAVVTLTSKDKNGKLTN